jgi:hypothetical protein
MNAYRILVGNSEEKRQLGRLKRTWDDIKINFRERYDGMVWTGLIWLRMGASGGVF